MSTDICVNCLIEYRVKKNGVAVEYIFGRDPSEYQGAAIHYGDLKNCPNCGERIITGIASHPAHLSYQEGYNEIRGKLDARNILFIVDLRYVNQDREMVKCS